MNTNKEDFDKIVRHVRDKLLRHSQLMNLVQVQSAGNTPIPINAVSEWIIMGIPETITFEGFLAATGEKKERKKPVVLENDPFDAFWLAYPASGNFSYNGVKFTATRALRSNKEVCRVLYHKGLKENNVTPEQVLNAMKKQVGLMKKQSYENGRNELQYMSAIEPYLRQAKFMAFTSADSGESDEWLEEQVYKTSTDQ